MCLAVKCTLFHHQFLFPFHFSLISLHARNFDFPLYDTQEYTAGNSTLFYHYALDTATTEYVMLFFTP